MLTIEEIERLIRDVPDFPQKGVIFKDITTVMTSPGALGDTVTHMQESVDHLDYDAVAAIESRGFIFGAVLAAREGLPLVLVRKPGKLPAETIAEDYQLEYGSNTVEIHRGSLPSGSRVLLVDDLVATGGSMLAASRLVERDGCRVAGAAAVINLQFLGGGDRITDSGVEYRYLINVE
ncbi:MAG: adenine phosphoribosyltransferase [Candidatus Fermentibacteraceae bacterium]